MLKKLLSLLVVVTVLTFGSTICAAANGTGRLVIFHTNDMHSRLLPTDDSGKSIGLAHMAAAVKSTKAKNPATLFFDVGDTFHGMPMINITNGEVLPAILNAAGYDAMTAGNHDFNYGSAQLERLAKMLKFPLLDANLVRKSDHKNIFKSYKIFKLADGITVGVFGLSTPETKYKTNPVNVTTVDFLNPVDVSKEMIKKLRPKCDVVIAIAHLGVDASSEFTSERLARETDGIDLIVDGHSHTVLVDGIRVKDTLIVQTGCYEHYLGRATLEVKNHKIVSKKSELLDADAVKAIAPVADKKVEALLAEADASAEKLLSAVVAHSDKKLSSERLLVRRNESELGNLIADSFRWETGADIAIVNGGGLRADLPEGDVTKRDVLAILPFGNTLVKVEIPGATLREALEHSVEYYPASFGGFFDVSGMTFSYDPSKPPKHRVEKVFVDGQPLDDQKIYTMALINFHAAGGDGYDMLKGLKVVGQFGTLEEILAKYLNQVGMKDESFAVGRITRLVEVPVPDAK